tara:strand:+ start:2472 stop:4040 length:1569 start_codon:yes stop_codon:yes gene_type:complete
MKEILWPKADSTHLTVYPNKMIDLENEIISRGMPVEALMEKVGIKISNWLMARKDLLRNGVVVVIGPGKNGGDGAVIARELFLKGVLTKLWIPFGIKNTLTLKHINYLTFIGVEKLENSPDYRKKDLWIDSIFGNNQNRGISDDIVRLFNKKYDQHYGCIVSIDIPTGISPHTGVPFKTEAIKSSITLSVGLKKIGILQDVAKPFVGEIHHIDIGITQMQLKNIQPKLLSLSQKDIKKLNLSLPPKNAYKYKRGRTLLVAGSSRYPGAAILAVQGALASGAGAVNALLPKFISQYICHHSPELLLSGDLDNSNHGNSLMSRNLNELDLDKFDSIMIGPGIGVDLMDWYKSEDKLKSFKGLLILDADALNRISLSNSVKQFFIERQADTWITPHFGEFARLFPKLDTKNNFEAALDISREFNIGILLKGANSIIADPANVAWQIYGSDPTSARAGLGDLLSGFVAGMSALELSSGFNIKTYSLAKYALIHSIAGYKCKSGSTASNIGKKIAKIVKKIKLREMS